MWHAVLRNVAKLSGQKAKLILSTELKVVETWMLWYLEISIHMIHMFSYVYLHTCKYAIQYTCILIVYCIHVYVYIHIFILPKYIDMVSHTCEFHAVLKQPAVVSGLCGFPFALVLAVQLSPPAACQSITYQDFFQPPSKSRCHEGIFYPHVSWEMSKCCCRL